MEAVCTNNYFEVIFQGKKNKKEEEEERNDTWYLLGEGRSERRCI